MEGVGHRGRRSAGATAVVAAAVAITLSSAAQTVRATTCGETPPGADKQAKATLTHDPGQSNLSKDFKKSLQPEELSMYFRVSGCDLPDDPADPSLTPIALKGQNNIPHDTLMLGLSFILICAVCRRPWVSPGIRRLERGRA
jgi:hypothetical protein